MIQSCITDLSIYCSYFLFQKNGTTVELNFVGALIPLLVSLVFLALVHGTRMKMIGKYSLLLGCIFTLTWASSDYVGGGISTPGPLVLLTLFAVSFALLYFNPDYISKNNSKSVIFRAYIIGTLGIVIADICRITGSILGVPFLGIKAPLLVIGGAGPSDGVFLGGLYFTMLLLFTWIILRFLKRRYQFEFGRAKKESSVLPITGGNDTN